MGLALSSLAASSACEAATCAGCLGVRCCCKLVKSSVRTRLAYLMMFLFASLAAWVLSNWATVILSFEPRLKYLPVHIGGASAVTRVMLGVSAFFGLLMVLFLGVSTKKDPRAFMEDGFWLVKVVLLLGLVSGAFFLPNSALPALGWMAFGGATVFILFQVILLIEFARQWNESWFSKWDMDNINGWYYLHAGSTLVLHGFTLSVTVAMYAMYTRVCGINALFITVNFFAALAGFLLSISPLVRERLPSAGALQSGVISAYATYMVWSAINAEGAVCAVTTAAPIQPASASRSQMAQLVIGVLFTIVSVCYSALSMSMQTDRLAEAVAGNGDELEGLLNENEVDDAETPADGAKPELKKAAKKAADGSDDVESQSGADTSVSLPYSLPFFHLTFALASMYMLNVLNNWMVLSTSDSGATAGQLIVGTGLAATWVKVVSSWLAHGLYMWTLVAPAVFTDREFQ
eukprot:Amastigsp_a676182_1679.p1 type:complete len:462 gc:universal Amastigsp_a676182_1679:62-1447(+)